MIPIVIVAVAALVVGAVFAVDWWTVRYLERHEQEVAE